MIKLFTKPGCPACVEVKRALELGEFAFETVDVSSPAGWSEMEKSLEKIDVDMRSIKSMPVMVSGGHSRAGHDCLVAIEEGELV